VWHIPVSGYRGRLRRRLGALTTWSDEHVVLVTQAGRRRLTPTPMDLDGDLVGVPTKQEYSWTQPS
jgi:hypothetical protein